MVTAVSSIVNLAMSLGTLDVWSWLDFDKSINRLRVHWLLASSIAVVQDLRDVLGQGFANIFVATGFNYK